MEPMSRHYGAASRTWQLPSRASLSPNLLFLLICVPLKALRVQLTSLPTAAALLESDHFLKGFPAKSATKFRALVSN
jgi:hypothetical protein